MHTDVCGQMGTSSLNGSQYFITFIDDYSRMCWAYFLVSKADVTGVFWKFKVWVENQAGKKLKMLRLDNGTE